MKEIAKLRISDADPRIKQVPSQELNEKIDVLYSHGYVYSPYYREFYNPFINTRLKAIVTFNLNVDRILVLHKTLEKEFLEKNHKYRTLREISKSINNGRPSHFLILLEGLAGHIGVLFLIIAIVAHIIGNTYIASSGALLSFFV